MENDRNKNINERKILAELRIDLELHLLFFHFIFIKS